MDEMQASSTAQPVLSMSWLGRLGRFGNQLFQYAFLRICALNAGASVQCRGWVGEALFGLQDERVSRRLPPAIEGEEPGMGPLDIVPEGVLYLERTAGTKSRRVGPGALDDGLAGVNLFGFFQFHTRHYRPYRDYFSSLFRPVPDLAEALQGGLHRLRSRGKTVVGVHLRRGDFFEATRLAFAVVFPAAWYARWLETVWDDLEDPVLLVCSDDLDSVLPVFQKFSPVTSRDLNVVLPERMQGLGVDFYVDFWLLSQCDVVAISNGSFGIMACMLNQRGHRFVRPNPVLDASLVSFDPWDSEPILWFGNDRSKWIKSLAGALWTTWRTQGAWAALKCLCWHYPMGWAKHGAIRAYFRYKLYFTPAPMDRSQTR
jgi:hypothetical protein